MDFKIKIIEEKQNLELIKDAWIKQKEDCIVKGVYELILDYINDGLKGLERRLELVNEYEERRISEGE